MSRLGGPVYEVTADLVLRAYAAGLFPMARSRDDEELHWISPDERGIIPLDDRFHVPARLRRTLRRKPFRVTSDQAFDRVFALCAEPSPGREDTWINDEIIRLFTELHRMGRAHSIECWDGDELVGGLYGLALGGAFFGESMFSRATDASKVALCYLVGTLRAGGFTLLDSQFVTPHLQQFGALEIPRHDYLRLLEDALEVEAAYSFPGDSAVDDWLTHSSTQTS